MPLTIVEFGAGTGVVTKSLLKEMNSESKLLSFEINSQFIKELQKIDDERLQIIHDGAENLQNHLDGKQADIIISTLPLAMLDKDLTKDILSEVKKNLCNGGKYIQIQYSLFSKKLLEQELGAVNVDFQLLNLPPTFIYQFQKNA